MEVPVKLTVTAPPLELSTSQELPPEARLVGARGPGAGEGEVPDRCPGSGSRLGLAARGCCLLSQVARYVEGVDPDVAAVAAVFLVPVQAML